MSKEHWTHSLHCFNSSNSRYNKVAFEVNGKNGIFLLFEDKPFIRDAAFDVGVLLVGKELPELRYRFSVLFVPLCREGNKGLIAVLDLEYLAQLIQFDLGGEVELLHEGDSVVLVDGFCHEGLELVGLTVIVDDTFLDPGVVFPYLLVDFMLRYLGV